MSTSTSWTAAATALTRVTHQRVQQIANEDIMLQALPQGYEATRQAHLERWDFGLADIRPMLPAIYADILARSRSDSFRGIARRVAAMQAMIHDRNDTKCHTCGRVGHLKIECPPHFNHQQQNDGQQPEGREEYQNNPHRHHQRNSGGGRGLVWCSNHKTTTHSDADCRARRL